MQDVLTSYTKKQLARWNGGIGVPPPPPDTISYSHFYDRLFNLADHWCGKAGLVSARAYHDFISWLHHELIVDTGDVEHTGCRFRWRMASYVSTHLPHDQDTEAPVPKDPEADAATLQAHRDVWIKMTDDDRQSHYKDSILTLPPNTENDTTSSRWNSITKVSLALPPCVYVVDSDHAHRGLQVVHGDEGGVPDSPCSPQSRAAVFLTLMAKAQLDEVQKYKETPWYRKIVHEVWLKEHMPGALQSASASTQDGKEGQNNSSQKHNETPSHCHRGSLSQDEARNIGHRELYTEQENESKPRADTITYEQYSVYLEDFNKIDKDGDGLLDRNEIQLLIQTQLGRRPTARQVTEVMKQIDIDENGYISFDEYLDWVLGKGWAVLPLSVAQIAAGMHKELSIPRHVYDTRSQQNNDAKVKKKGKLQSAGATVINLTFGMK